MLEILIYLFSAKYLMTKKTNKIIKLNILEFVGYIQKNNFIINKLS